MNFLPISRHVSILKHILLLKKSYINVAIMNILSLQLSVYELH